MVAYDARGHGALDAGAGPDDYGYDDLADDLLAVLDDRGIDRAVLAGASMGAHTRDALRARPPRPRRRPRDRHAGLRPRGATATTAASAGTRSPRACGAAASRASSRPTATPNVPEQWHETIDRSCTSGSPPTSTPTRSPTRCSAVPRSRAVRGAGTSWPRSTLPTVVVASRDEVDPGHPYAVGERYAEAIPGAELRSEEPGSSPLAWQGGQVSKVISELRASASGAAAAP